LLLIGIIAASYAAGLRYYLEKGNRTVELAMPYGEMASLARQAGRQPVEVMKLFHEQGMTAIFLNESDVEELKKSGEFAVWTGQELFALTQAGNNTNAWLAKLIAQKKIKTGDTCFITSSGASARRVEEQLKIKTPEARLYSKGNNEDVSGGEGNAFVVCTPADLTALADLGLGFPAEVLTGSRLASLDVMICIRGWPGVTESGLKQVLAPLKNIPNLSGIAFSGNTVPGYPTLLKALRQDIQSLEVPLLQTEFYPQEGLAKLSELLRGRVLNLHSAEPEKIKIYSAESLRSRLLLAASERNVRVLLVYPLIETGKGDPLEQNLKYISAIKQDLLGKNLQVGKAHPLFPLTQPKWLLFLMGLGVISGGLWLCLRVGVCRLNPVIGLLVTAGWVGLLYAAPSMGSKLMALAAAVIFPVLSIMINLPPGRVPWGKSILIFIRTSAFTLLGALFMVGLLADTRYMLRLDQFVGVKVAYTFPLVLLSIAILGRGFSLAKIKTAWDYMTGLLNKPVLWKWVIGGALLIIVAAVYLIRTGTQEIIPPSQAELKVRLFLEQLLVVRPRTKEFLIGHPCLIFLFYLGYRDKKYLPLLLLGAIGQISIVNTFIHIHTPLAASGLRTFNGLWLGILVGSVIYGAGRLFVARREKVLLKKM